MASGPKSTPTIQALGQCDQFVELKQRHARSRCSQVCLPSPNQPGDAHFSALGCPSAGCRRAGHCGPPAIRTFCPTVTTRWLTACMPSATSKCTNLSASLSAGDGKALWAQCYQELLNYLHSHGHWADGDASHELGEVNIGAAKRAILSLARARTDMLFSLPRALVEAVVDAGKPYEDRKVRGGLVSCGSACLAGWRRPHQHRPSLAAFTARWALGLGPEMC